MRCTAEALTIEPIEQRSNVFHDDVQYTVVAGVTGCNKQATYVYDSKRGIWVMNNDATAAKP